MSIPALSDAAPTSAASLAAQVGGAANSAPLPVKPSWLETFKVYLEPATWRMLLLGFSAGLPLLLVLGTLSFCFRRSILEEPRQSCVLARALCEL